MNVHESGAAVKNKTRKGTTGGDDGDFGMGSEHGVVPRTALVTSGWGARALVQNGTDTFGESVGYVKSTWTELKPFLYPCWG